MKDRYDVPDLWQLEPDTPEWLPTIVARLLAVGVPPTAIGKAFDVEPTAIKELQAQIRVEKYGTAELAEVVHGMMWTAYEDTLALIRTAPPSRRLQLNMQLLSRASALVGNQTPDSVARMQAELENVMAETRGTTQEASTSIYETVSIDAPPDDPEEGSAS